MPLRKLDPRVLLDALADEKIFSSLGVPDSTLAPFLQLLASDPRFENLNATNECEAMAIAMGQSLATKQPSLVYLQNSGFGKTIHPITSLLSPEICRIPVLLLIGWRGVPDGKPDEPQHAMMGRILPDLLEAIEVPFEVLSNAPDEVARAVKKARKHLDEKSSPYALIVRPGLFLKADSVDATSATLARKRVLEALVEHLPKDSLCISTTGKTSRELFFIREAKGISHESDLYTVGGMGCASSIGLGIALKIAASQPDRTVCVLDGDGAALMQMGTLATIGHHKPHNLLHCIIDNASYESTGAQPTISPSVDLAGVAKACGYPWTRTADTQEAFEKALTDASEVKELRMIVVKVAPGSDPKLGRPNQTPRENAESFQRNIVNP